MWKFIFLLTVIHTTCTTYPYPAAEALIFNRDAAPPAVQSFSGAHVTKLETQVFSIYTVLHFRYKHFDLEKATIYSSCDNPTDKVCVNTDSLNRRLKLAAEYIGDNIEFIQSRGKQQPVVEKLLQLFYNASVSKLLFSKEEKLLLQPSLSQLLEQAVYFKTPINNKAIIDDEYYQTFSRSSNTTKLWTDEFNSNRPFKSIQLNLLHNLWKFEQILVINQREQTIFDACRRNILNPFIIPDRDLKPQLDKIEPQILQQELHLLYPINDLSSYYKEKLFHCLHHKDGFEVFVKVPLLDKREQLTVYKVTPIPLAYNDYTYTLNLPSRFIVKTTEKLFPLPQNNNEQDLPSLVQLPLLLQQFSTEEQQCYNFILNGGQITINHTCSYKVLRVLHPQLTQVEDNIYYLTNPSKDNHVYCELTKGIWQNQIRSVPFAQYFTIRIHLPCSCYIDGFQSTNYVLVSETCNYTNLTQILQVPPEFFKNKSHVQPQFETAITFPYTDVNFQRPQFYDHYYIGSNNKQHITNTVYTLSAIITSLIILLAIVVAVLLYHICTIYKRIKLPIWYSPSTYNLSAPISITPPAELIRVNGLNEQSSFPVTPPNSIELDHF